MGSPLRSQSGLSSCSGGRYSGRPRSSSRFLASCSNGMRAAKSWPQTGHQPLASGTTLSPQSGQLVWAEAAGVGAGAAGLGAAAGAVTGAAITSSVPHSMQMVSPAGTLASQEGQRMGSQGVGRERREKTGRVQHEHHDSISVIFFFCVPIFRRNNSSLSTPPFS